MPPQEAHSPLEPRRQTCSKYNSHQGHDECSPVEQAKKVICKDFRRILVEVNSLHTTLDARRNEGSIADLIREMLFDVESHGWENKRCRRFW